MSDFSALTSFKVNNPTDENGLDHIFYPVKQESIDEVEAKLTFSLPTELKEFYIQVGYGFLWQTNKDSFDRILSPKQVAQITLKEDFYGGDPDLELYDDLYEDEKLLFFEVNEGVYLAIDKHNNNGKNAVFYFEDKISDSLEEFVRNFISNPDLIKELEQ